MSPTVASFFPILKFCSARRVAETVTIRQQDLCLLSKWSS